MKLANPAGDLDEVHFHQRAPKRSYVTKREADILLSTVEAQETNMTINHEEGLPVWEVRRRAVAAALAARDHAAFSAIIYAGLRIEETTALVADDLCLSRSEEQVRVARGKGNQERMVPMSPKLKKSLRRYLKVRDELVLAGEAPPATSSSARRSPGSPRTP
jgi:site-specific recombinase XerD